MWYLLCCKGQQDRKVCNFLGARHITYFCPEIPKKTPKGEVQELMFPGYVFVDLNDKEGVYHEVKFTPGVWGFLKCGDDPVTIAGSLITSIKKQAEDINKLSGTGYFKEGETVAVIEGAFQGYEAVFQYKTGPQRVNVLLELCNRQVSVKINPVFLEKHI